MAREWYARYSIKWVPSYQKAVIRILEENLFPHMGKRPINAITPRELLTVLRRVEERGTPIIVHKALRDTGWIFRYAVVTGRAEHDIAADLRGALAPTANDHHAAITDPVAVGELLRKIYAYEGNFFISRALRLAPLVFVRGNELIRTDKFPDRNHGGVEAGNDSVGRRVRQKPHAGRALGHVVAGKRDARL